MIRLFLLFLLFSCSDDIMQNNSINAVQNLIINLDRTSNEIYIQVETSLNLGTVDSVTVDLEYAGDIGIDYTNSFTLYLSLIHI